jgi:hypothetical protein
VAISIIACNITQAASIIATQHRKDFKKKKKKKKKNKKKKKIRI